MSTNPENIDVSKLDWKAKTGIKYIIESFILTSEEIEKYKNLSSNQLKLQEYHKYPSFTFRSSDLKHIADLGKLQSQADNWFKECTEIKAKNALVASNNQQVYNSIISMLKLFGLKLEGPDFKSRKMLKPIVKKDFVRQLAEECNQYDSGLNFDSQYQDMTDEISAEIVRRVEANNLAERQHQAEKRKKEKEALVLQLIQKYKIDTSNGIPDDDTIFDAIVYSNKYFRLANAMYQVYDDPTSDNYELLQYALAEFHPVTPLDVSIRNELIPILEDWEQDGAVFRSCKHNFNFMYELAEKEYPETYADYLKFMEYYESGND